MKLSRDCCAHVVLRLKHLIKECKKNFKRRGTLKMAVYRLMMITNICELVVTMHEVEVLFCFKKAVGPNSEVES